MNIQDLLLKYIAKQYGISEEQAADLVLEKTEEDGEEKFSLKNDAFDLLLSKDKERIKTVKESSVDKTEIFNEAFNKAKVDVMSKAEKKIAKQYGVEQAKFDELIKNIITQKVSEASKSSEITDDKIKVHPLYLDLEKRMNGKLEELTTQYDQKIQDIETSQKQKDVFRTVSDKILSYFDGLNPILSSDAAKASNQRLDFVKKFSDYSWQEQENGDPIAIKDGRRLEDGHGNVVSLKSLTENVASQFYDFKVQKDKQGPGNRNEGKVIVPTSEEEYNAAIFNASTQEERDQIEAAYSSE